MKILKYLSFTFIVLLVLSVGYVIWWNLIGINQFPSQNKPFISAEKLMATVNDWRYSQGLQPYTNSEELCSFAQTRLNEVKTDWSHNKFWERAENESFPFEYKYLGENLASSQTSEDQMLRDWLASPTHKENLDKNYTHSCIKCSEGYCVQIFAIF